MRTHRLEMVCSLFDDSDLIADIGCDHGYLAILAKQNNFKVIQLIDNKIGPLENAKKNVYDDNIIYSLSSGLNDLDNRVNCITMCGMGGELIINLLTENIDKAKKLNKIILQPNRNLKDVRTFLNQNSFLITNEKIVEENHKFYEIIVCHYSDNKQILNNNELEFGPILLKEKNDIFIKKYHTEIARLNKLINKENQDYLNSKINLYKEITKKA